MARIADNHPLGQAILRAQRTFDSECCEARRAFDQALWLAERDFNTSLDAARAALSRATAQARKDYGSDAHPVK